ncbi:MAG: hypothetical protein ABIJ36_00990, partial [Patescibacteria group bacterium]
MSSNILSFIKLVFIFAAISALSIFMFYKHSRDRAVETCLTVGYEEYRNQDTGSSSRIPNMDVYRE